MTLSRTDLLPVLSIMAGSAVGVVASGLVLEGLSHDERSDPLVTVGSHMSAGPPLVYIDGVRIETPPGVPPMEEWLLGESGFTGSAVRSALVQWLEKTGTSPLLIEGIQDIEVVRGSAAVREYGDEAAGGVILISLRRAEGADRISPAAAESSYTMAPQIVNIGAVRRAMFAAYPALLRDAGVGGTATVRFFVDESGTVRETRLDQSTGHVALDEAALTVADVFEFSPAVNGDVRVATWVQHSMTFEVR